LTLDDSRKVLCDLKIPEVYAAILKTDLKIKAKFSAYKDKIYNGVIESIASRVDAQTRSILARAQIYNENSEIIPGSLLEIEILYNEKNALSIPDTSIMYEGRKKFIYKIIENNIIKKTEVETGVRSLGTLEVLSGLIEGDKIIAEGLTKVRPGMKVKPIIK
jgi:membrane fusion protein (multidrug efflux system)